MSLVGVLTTAESTRNQRQDAAGVREVIDEFNGVFHFELTTSADIPLALQRLAHYGAEVVAIVGDGATISAVLSCIYRASPFERLPVLALIPLGRNMMAEALCGRGGKPQLQLRRLLEFCRDSVSSDYCTGRQLLRIDGLSTEGPVYGLFFGAGTITQGIHFCRHRLYPIALPSVVAHALTAWGLVIGAFVGSLFGRSLFGTQPIAVTFDQWGSDQQESAPATYFAVTATTLDRCVVSLMPFLTTNSRAGTVGAVKFLSVRDRFPAVMRGFLAGVTKRSQFARTTGVVAEATTDVRLRLQGLMTIDGELYDLPPGQEIRISAAPELTFICFGAQKHASRGETYRP